MTARIDYFLSVASPWTFLGSARFIDLVTRTGAQVVVRPMDFTQVLAASGGLPYAQRAAQRASYRQDDLARWRHRLGISLVLEPAFYPVDRTLASHLLIAVRALGQDAALRLSHGILKAIWQQDRNIADAATLRAIADATGLDGAGLLAAAQAPPVAVAFQHDTDAAIAAGVFGAPTWVIDGERFWGQDRLAFVEERLARAA